MKAVFATLALLLTAVLPVAQDARPARAGDLFPEWTPGTLDLHQISTGHGNAAFFTLPDGTTLLLDTGNAGDGVPYSEPRPDATRTPGEWVSRYVHHMIGARPLKLDYAILTHLHPDHIGQITGNERKSANGDYLASGITEVGDAIPIGTLIDRGWPDYPYLPPPADRMFTNYRAFVASQVRTRGMRAMTARAGRADQIVPVRDRAAAGGIEIRIVAANDQVWTGKGDAVKTRFPALASIALPEDRPTENMCSVALRIKYGRFDYFTGGDMPGYPVPGAPAWHDVESDVARAIGPTDVHVVNHHGSIEEENPFFLATLQSRVLVLPSWSPTHPSQDVIKRLLSTRIYAKPHDVFAVLLRDVTKASIGARASQVASDHGHVVVRVEAGGARYWVFVLDDTAETYRVRSVHGPYLAE